MKRKASRSKSRSGNSAALEQPVLKAARQVFQRQYLAFREARGKMSATSDSEALHDMRVALNRFRAAVRLFRPFMSDVGRSELNALLSRFRSRLGVARDWEVWVAFLEEVSAKKGCSVDPAWSAYLAGQRKRNRQLRTDVVKLLESSECRELDRRVETFLERHLPSLIELSPGGSYGAYMASKVRRGYKRILKRKIKPRHASPKEMHRLRKRIRRIRYWAEFAAPDLGGPVVKLAGRLKALTTSLGNVHDMDVYLDRIRSKSIRPPRGLKATIERRRAAGVRDFKKAWDELRDRSFRKKVLGKLKKTR